MTPLTVTIANSNTPAFLDWSKVLDDEEWILVRFQLLFYVDPCLWNMWDFLNDVSWLMNVKFVNFNSSCLWNRSLCYHFWFIVKFIDWRRSCVPMENVSRIPHILVSFSLLSCLGFNNCLWFLFNKLIQNNFLWRRSVNIFDDWIIVVFGFVILKNLNFEICWCFRNLFELFTFLFCLL